MFSLKKIFFNSIEGVNSAAFIIGFFGLASKVLGFARDWILAGIFGVGDKLDMYYAAFRIPDMVFNLLIIGALSASFVPILSGYFYKKDQEKFFGIIGNVLNIFTIAVVAATVLMFFIAPYMLKFIVPGWSGEKFATTVALTRIMLLSPIFLTLSSVAGGVVQSTRRFLVYALAPIAYNIGIIFSAVFLADFWGIYGIAAGVVLGSALHFLIQWPAVKNLGYKYSFSFNWRDPDIRRIFKTMLPRTLSLGVGQFNLFIITSVASTLAAGSLAIFNYATNIQNIFFGLIGISFSVAVFPALSSYFALKQYDKFHASFSRACREIILFIVPAAAYLAIFKSEIVRLIYSAGKFDPGSAALTENVLLFLALGIIAQSLISLIVRTFWALGDTKTPFYASLFGLAVNVFFAVELGKYYGVAGLAMAFSLTNIVNFIMLAYLLRRKPMEWGGKNILKTFFGVLFITVISGYVIWQLMNFAPLGNGAVKAILIFARLFAGSAFFAGLFLLLGKLFGVNELFVFTRAIKRRVVEIFRPDIGAAG